MEVVFMLTASFNFKGQKTVATVRAFIYYWLLLKLNRKKIEKKMHTSLAPQ